MILVGFLVGTVIQGDSRVRVNILGGDSMGHCEEISPCEHVSNSEWLPRWSCLNVQIKYIVNCNKNRNYSLLILF